MTRHSSKPNELGNVHSIRSRAGNVSIHRKIKNIYQNQSHRVYHKFWMKRIRCKSKNENAVRIHWLSLIADLMEKLNLPCSMYLRNTTDRLRSLIVEEGQRDGEILENLSTVQRKCRIS